MKIVRNRNLSELYLLFYFHLVHRAGHLYVPVTNHIFVDASRLTASRRLSIAAVFFPTFFMRHRCFASSFLIASTKCLTLSKILRRTFPFQFSWQSSSTLLLAANLNPSPGDNLTHLGGQPPVLHPSTWRQSQSSWRSTSTPPPGDNLTHLGGHLPNLHPSWRSNSYPC